VDEVVGTQRAGAGSVAAPAAPSPLSGLSLSGRYEHRVDRKGRLVLPAAFRAHFSAGGHLQQWQGTCLTLFTPGGWEAWLAYNREQFKAGGHNASSLVRRLRSQADMVEIDGQGRFVMPPRFRVLAPLDHPVTVLGQHDRVEIWLPERLDADDPGAGNVIELNMDDYENHAR